MKKIIILFVCLWTVSAATAQTPDTIQWIHPGYHYSCWYDDCPDFFDTVMLGGEYTYPRMRMGIGAADMNGRNRSPMKPEHVDRPTKIVGLAFAEAVNEHDFEIRF